MADTILVVDDEANIRESLRGVLVDEGYEVLEAENGRAALAALDRTVPRLAIVDIWMPEMDGIELVQRMRQQVPRVPIVVISGHGTIETAVHAIRLGATDFLEKPFQLDALLQTVNRVLGDDRGRAGAPVSGPPLAPPRRVPQRTIARSVVVNGQGLHSGVRTGLILQPLPPGSGIVFGSILSGETVPALIDYVDSTGYATTLARRHGGPDGGAPPRDAARLRDHQPPGEDAGRGADPRWLGRRVLRAPRGRRDRRAGRHGGGARDRPPLRRRRRGAGRREHRDRACRRLRGGLYARVSAAHRPPGARLSAHRRGRLPARDRARPHLRVRQGDRDARGDGARERRAAPQRDPGRRGGGGERPAALPRRVRPPQDPRRDRRLLPARPSHPRPGGRPHDGALGQCGAAAAFAAAVRSAGARVRRGAEASCARDASARTCLSGR